MSPKDKDPRKIAAGRLGGLANVAKHGTERMRQIGKAGGVKGGRTTLERYGREYFRRIGARGGGSKRGQA
jgi:general stress protein YciG